MIKKCFVIWAGKSYANKHGGAVSLLDQVFDSKVRPSGSKQVQNYVILLALL